jgi:hypothetical protein
MLWVFGVARVDRGGFRGAGLHDALLNPERRGTDSRSTISARTCATLSGGSQSEDEPPKRSTAVGLMRCPQLTT